MWGAVIHASQKFLVSFIFTICLIFLLLFFLNFDHRGWLLKLWEVAFVVNGFKQLIHKWLGFFLKKYIQLVYTKGFKFLFTFVLLHQRNNILGERRRVCITDGLEGFRQPCFQGIEVFNDHLRSKGAFPRPPPQLKLIGADAVYLRKSTADISW